VTNRKKKRTAKAGQAGQPIPGALHVATKRFRFVGQKGRSSKKERRKKRVGQGEIPPDLGGETQKKKKKKKHTPLPWERITGVKAGTKGGWEKLTKGPDRERLVTIAGKAEGEGRKKPTWGVTRENGENNDRGNDGRIGGEGGMDTRLLTLMPGKKNHRSNDGP